MKLKVTSEKPNVIGTCNYGNYSQNSLPVGLTLTLAKSESTWQLQTNFLKHLA
jgi:hypothetical protein